MQLWAVLVASAVTLALLALFAALRIEIEARGQGERSGFWVLAGAVGVGPFALAAVGRAGAPPHFELRALGRRFPLRGRRRAKPEPPKPALAEPEGTGSSSRKAQPNKLRLGPLDLLEFVLEERGRLRIERLDVELDYGFDDIVLTGKIAGALYALSGALPATVHVDQRPRFGGAESWTLGLNGALRFSLGRVLLELVWYMFRKWRTRVFASSSRTATASAESPS